METDVPAVMPVSKRKLRSAARLQDFQQARRLSRLRGILLRAVKRLRFDRMWQVHNEWYAARARSALAYDSRVGGATPILESEAIGANRAEASVEQRSTAASNPSSQQQDACSGDFVPGLPWAEVEGALRSAAASWPAR